MVEEEDFGSISPISAMRLIDTSVGWDRIAGCDGYKDPLFDEENLYSESCCSEEREATSLSGLTFAPSPRDDKWSPGISDASYSDTDDSLDSLGCYNVYCHHHQSRFLTAQWVPFIPKAVYPLPPWLIE